MKKRNIVTCASLCLVLLLSASFLFDIWHPMSDDTVLKIGFLCDGNESTPYTYNFLLGRSALQEEYGERVEILTRTNVQEDDMAAPLRELVQLGCRLIFTNSYSEQMAKLAPDYPQVQFCQVSYLPVIPDNLPDNYHTFKGAIHQGRYISGIAAGMKLRQLIDAGVLLPEEAVIGYVAAFSSPEIISGFTAFLLGIRQVVPEATMRVRYTGTWVSYSQEKASAKQLIQEGCVLIGQHTDTIGPAMACEEALGSRTVYHVGYNESMLDTALSTSLISTRINWTPYILSAAKAVLKGRAIESELDATVIRGHDALAGFDKGWVEMLEINTSIAAPGTAERVAREIAAFAAGKDQVFQGNHIGINPLDPSDTINLVNGYTENATSSSPAFGYILQDIITIDNP